MSPEKSELLDLRDWHKTSPPPLKKDYYNQCILVRDHKGKHAYNRTPESDPTPDPAVMQIVGRYKNFQDIPVMKADWRCPCCQTLHRHEIPESLLESGHVTFLTPVPGINTEPLEKSNGRVVYLACPYSHSDPAIREQRWLAASRAAASLMFFQQVAVISPVSMGHPISVLGEDYGLESDFATWQGACLALLSNATDFCILTLEGWKESTGVHAELDQARRQGLPILRMQPEGEGYKLENLYEQ